MALTGSNLSPLMKLSVNLSGRFEIDHISSSSFFRLLGLSGSNSPARGLCPVTSEPVHGYPDFVLWNIFFANLRFFFWGDLRFWIEIIAWQCSHREKSHFNSASNFINNSETITRSHCWKHAMECQKLQLEMSRDDSYFILRFYACYISIFYIRSR